MNSLSVLVLSAAILATIIQAIVAGIGLVVFLSVRQLIRWIRRKRKP